MTSQFPSIEFLSSLERQAAVGDDVLASLGENEIIFGIDVEGRMFVIEFAERACAAIALSGNPNDMDFVLTGSMENWLKLFSSVEDEAQFRSLMRPGGPIDPVCCDDEGFVRFEESLPALQTFFTGVRSFEWSTA